jgi:hypothetical protein
MPLFMLLAFFSKNIILATSPSPKLFYLSKTRANIYLLNKAFTKTKYLQNYRDIHSGVVHYFINLYFVDIYKGISNIFKKTC